MGLVAAKRGDSATTMREWSPLAEHGYANTQLSLAQTNLGAAYGEGQGIEQNDVIAHMWLNIASARGAINAQASVRHIHRRMSPADISKARKLARDCVKSNYRGGGATPI